MQLTPDVVSLLLTVGLNLAVSLMIVLVLRLRAYCRSRKLKQRTRVIEEDEKRSSPFQSKNNPSQEAQLPSYPLLQTLYEEDQRTRQIDLNQSEESQLTDRSSFGDSDASPRSSRQFSLADDDRSVPRISKRRNLVRENGSCLEKLKFLWRIGDRQLAKLASLDSYLYLNFLKYSAYYFLFMAIPSIVLLGIYYSEDCEDHVNSLLDCLTVQNSFSNDQKMFIVFFAVFCYSLLGYFFIYLYASKVQAHQYFQLDNHSSGDSEIGNHALLIRGVPEKIRPPNGDNQLFQFFRTKFREDVISAHVIPTFAELASLLEKQQTLRNKMKKLQEGEGTPKFLEVYNCSHNKHKIVESMIWQKICHCCCCCLLGKQLDAVAYYQALEQATSMKIEQLRMHEPYMNSNCGIGFVTFSSQESATQALLYVKNYQKSTIAGKGFQESNLDVRSWEVSPAPPPSDIIWNVLTRNTQSYKCCKSCCLTVILVVFSVVLVIGIIVVDRINSIKALTGDAPLSNESDFLMFVQSYFTPVLLLIVTAIITPLLIFKVDRWEEHELKSDRILSLLRKNFVFIGLNTILLPIIGCALAFSFLGGSDNPFNEEFTLQMSRASQFFLRYILQMTFFLNVALLLGVPYYAHKMHKSKSKQLLEPNLYDEIIQSKITKHFRNWFFEIAHSKVLSISVFSIVQSLLVITPLVVPIGCLFFFVKCWIDKWNIVFVYERSRGYSPTTRQFLIKYSVFSIFAFQFIMAGIFLISEIKILVLIGGLLIIFGFLIALMVCRRFARERTRRPTTRNRAMNRSDQPQLDFKMAQTSARDMYPELQERLKDAYLHPCEKTKPPPTRPRKKKIRLNYNRDMKSSQQQPRQPRKMIGSPRVTDVRLRAPGNSQFSSSLNRI